MDILPAIDILGGKAVRLAKGDYNAVTVYNDDPAAQAACRELGCKPRFPILLPERLKATDDCRC